MKDLYIKPTPKSPEIDFKTNGFIKISGVSALENSYQFYREPIKWITEYVLNPASRTIVNIDLDFFNTSSQVNIFEILTMLAELKKSGFDVVFNWFYSEDDLLELGEDIANLLNIQFNFIKKEKK